MKSVSGSVQTFSCFNFILQATGRIIPSNKEIDDKKPVYTPNRRGSILEKTSITSKEKTPSIPSEGNRRFTFSQGIPITGSDKDSFDVYVIN